MQLADGQEVASSRETPGAQRTIAGDAGLRRHLQQQASDLGDVTQQAIQALGCSTESSVRTDQIGFLE